MIPKDQEAEFYAFYEVSERGHLVAGDLSSSGWSTSCLQHAHGHPFPDPVLPAGAGDLPFVNVPKSIEEARRQPGHDHLLEPAGD